MKNRILSLMLVLCVVFSMVPTAAFATDGTTPIGTSDVGEDSILPPVAVCQHAHDGTCGYTEGSPVVEPTDCTYIHEHSEACGFAEGSAEVEATPCTHECAPVGEDSILPPVMDCTCETKCTAGEDSILPNAKTTTQINPDCPVCGAEGADLTDCEGKAAVPAPRMATRSNEFQITSTLNLSSATDDDDCTRTRRHSAHDRSGGVSDPSDGAPPCWSWVAGTKTLTLNNVDIAVGDEAIQLPPGSNIVVNGTNTVNSTAPDKSGILVYADDGDTTMISGTGTLTVTSAWGINGNAGSLTISGNGLVIESTATVGPGIFSSNSITISSGAMVTATGGTHTNIEFSHGIRTADGGTITLDGAQSVTSIAQAGAKPFSVAPTVTGMVRTSANNWDTTDGTCTYVEGETPTTFADLKTAITDAPDGATITLAEGIFTADSNLTIDKNITLDLNGQTLDMGSSYYVEVTGTANFTVMDSGSNGKITGSSATTIANTNTGAVTVEGGTIENTSGGASAIHNESTGTVTVSGGTVSGTSQTGRAIFNQSTGKITISGDATVTSANTSDIQGTIYLLKVPDGSDKVVLDIQGGTVKNTAENGYAVYFDDVTGVNSSNVGDYLTIAEGATVGKVKPAPAEVTEPWDGTWNTLGKGIGFNGTNSLKVTLPTTGKVSYGTINNNTIAQTAVSADSLPENGWNWAVIDTSGTQKLILNNVIVNSTSGKDIVMIGKQLSEIELRGNNTFTGTGSTALSGNKVDFTITGNGNLTVSGEGIERGISTTGRDIILSSTGTITITAGGNGISSDSVTINSGTIDITTSDDGKDGTIDNAVWSKSTININGGKVTAKSRIGVEPFRVEPTLGTGVTHSGGAWNNTTGIACVYEKKSGGGGSSSGGGSYDEDYESSTTTKPAQKLDRPSENVNQSQLDVDAAKVAKDTTTAVQSGKDSVLVQNANSITPAAFKAIADAAAKAGGKVTLFADTTKDGNVAVRLYLDPVKGAALTAPLKLHGGIGNTATTALFDKCFTNKTVIVSLAQQGSFGMPVHVAAKVNLSGLDTKTLYFYSYNKATNIYTRIAAPDYWIDTYKYLHFTSTLGGDIIITDKPLESK